MLCLTRATKERWHITVQLVRPSNSNMDDKVDDLWNLWSP